PLQASRQNSHRPEPELITSAVDTAVSLSRSALAQVHKATCVEERLRDNHRRRCPKEYPKEVLLAVLAVLLPKVCHPVSTYSASCRVFRVFKSVHFLCLDTPQSSNHRPLPLTVHLERS